jgi:hypothetical protein
MAHYPTVAIGAAFLFNMEELPRSAAIAIPV